LSKGQSHREKKEKIIMANKKEIVALIAEVTDLGTNAKGEKIKTTKKEAEAYLDGAVTAFEILLAKGEKVNLSGFGAFEVRDRDERTAFNPKLLKELKDQGVSDEDAKAQATVAVPAKKAPAFVASPVLKDLVNGVARG
jgi:DNA-binding protein HU-beta